MNKIRVILADDNIKFCEQLGEYLQSREEFEVVAIATNAMDALKHLISTKCDVIAMDLIMPHMDGLEVLEKIRSMSFTLRPKVLIISAVRQDVFMQKSLSVGADYYILKPCDFEMVARRMIEIVWSEESENHIGGKPVSSVAPKKLESLISQMLQDIGIPPQLKGYGFIREALLLVIDEKYEIKGITKQIYPAIAKKFASTPSRVERSIRHSIEVAWNRGNMDTINRVFGYTINREKGKPTNSEFIAMIADRIKTSYDY